MTAWCRLALDDDLCLVTTGKGDVSRDVRERGRGNSATSAEGLDVDACDWRLDPGAEERLVRVSSMAPAWVDCARVGRSLAVGMP